MCIRDRILTYVILHASAFIGYFAFSRQVLLKSFTIFVGSPSLLVKGEELRRERIAAGKCPDLVKATLTRSCDLRPRCV